MVHRIKAADSGSGQFQFANMIRQSGIQHGLTPSQSWNGYSTSNGYNIPSMGLSAAARIEVVHSTEDRISENISVHTETHESIDPPASRLDQVDKRKEGTQAGSELVLEGSTPRVERVTSWLETVPDGMAHIDPSVGSPPTLTVPLEMQEADCSSPIPNSEAWESTTAARAHKHL